MQLIFTQVPIRRRPYKFGYAVNNKYSSNDYGHHETSDGNVVSGSYHVLLPDGRKQIVTYRADENGYVADVKYEVEAKNPEPIYYQKMEESIPSIPEPEPTGYTTVDTPSTEYPVDVTYYSTPALTQEVVTDYVEYSPDIKTERTNSEPAYYEVEAKHPKPIYYPKTEETTLSTEYAAAVDVTYTESPTLNEEVVTGYIDYSPAITTEYTSSEPAYYKATANSHSAADCTPIDESNKEATYPEVKWEALKTY